MDAAPHGLRPLRQAGRRLPVLPDPDADDATSLVVARGTAAYAVLNLYPYAPGHLMVCPTATSPTRGPHARGVGRADGDDPQAMRGDPRGQRAGTRSTSASTRAAPPAAAAAHLHQHVVPRWPGDPNFIPVIGRTKILPQLLTDTRALLADAWPSEPGT